MHICFQWNTVGQVLALLPHNKQVLGSNLGWDIFYVGLSLSAHISTHVCTLFIWVCWHLPTDQRKNSSKMLLGVAACISLFLTAFTHQQLDIGTRSHCNLVGTHTGLYLAFPTLLVLWTVQGLMRDHAEQQHITFTVSFHALPCFFYQPPN